MPDNELSGIERRLDNLEQQTVRQLTDARDIHRREHDAAEKAHSELHEATAKSHEHAHGLQRETGQALVAGYETRFRLEEKAQEVASQQMERRLDLLNEFREQLRDQTSTFITRDLAEEKNVEKDRRIDRLSADITRRFDEISARLEAVERVDIKAEGRQIGQGGVIAIIVGVVAFVGSLLGVVVVVMNLVT